jgi:hypothetical protein
MAPSGESTDWGSQHWQNLTGTIRQRLASLRSQTIPADAKMITRAAQVACADVVLSSCPVTQLLAVYAGVPLVALGANPTDLPQREGLRCLGDRSSLQHLSEQDVLAALGF